MYEVVVFLLFTFVGAFIAIKFHRWAMKDTTGFVGVIISAFISTFVFMGWIMSLVDMIHMFTK